MEISLSNGKKYWLTFAYKNSVTNKNKLSNKIHARHLPPNRRITYCTIYQERVELVTTSVSCHVEDRYVKSQGRKMALTKALDILQLTKEEKAEFWKQYFEYTSPKPTITIPLELFNKLIAANGAISIQ